MRKMIITGAAFALNSILFAACSPRSDSQVSGWGLESTSYGGNALPLCFERRGVSDVELASVTMSLFSHAKSEFSRTNLSLTGLGPCGTNSGSREIRLTWVDADEFADDERRESLEGMSQIGNGFIYGVNNFTLPQRVQSSIKAVPNLILNAHVFKRYQSLQGPSAAVSHFKSVFLHELGHAVGMLHEHAQGDSTCVDRETVEKHIEIWNDAGAITKPAIVGTSYDPYSIMNYCYLFERSSTVAVGFSNKDILTINALYPKTESTGKPSPQDQPPVPQPSSKSGPLF